MLRFLFLFIVTCLVIGFLVPVFSQDKSNVYCTEMGCTCTDSEGAPQTGERKCNSCGSSEIFFSFVFVGVERVCQFDEILMCQEGIATDTSYTYPACKIKIFTS